MTDSTADDDTGRAVRFGRLLNVRIEVTTVTDGEDDFPFDIFSDVLARLPVADVNEFIVSLCKGGTVLFFPTDFIGVVA